MEAVRMIIENTTVSLYHLGTIPDLHEGSVYWFLSHDLEKKSFVQEIDALRIDWVSETSNSQWCLTNSSGDKQRPTCFREKNSAELAVYENNIQRNKSSLNISFMYMYVWSRKYNFWYW